MTYNINAAQLEASQLVEEVGYVLYFKSNTGADINLRFKLSTNSVAQAKDVVMLRNRSKLKILQDLKLYPSVLGLADTEKNAEVFAALETSLKDVVPAERGIYIFGAHKIGAKMARLCTEHKLKVVGFIDNDQTKQGQILDGIPIVTPDKVNITDEIVVIGSGHFSNEIIRQTFDLKWPLVLNMHQLLFALHAHHGPEADFRNFSSSLITDANRFISAFLELDDDESRKVFDGLIQMRTTLDTKIADEFKSPFQDEYFDLSYISTADTAYYVDAGAAAGDTLERIEKRFGTVQHAYMFEPELPAYYEGLKKFSSRDNVFFYNFGLSSEYGKFTYQPDLSFDILNEFKNPIPNDITSFIQAVKLDDVIKGNVTMFKLDIEGAEVGALQGATETIRQHHPKLCVCAYHRADDLWNLIDQVKRIDNSYRVGLRHYADILEDTCLYFY